MEPSVEHQSEQAESVEHAVDCSKFAPEYDPFTRTGTKREPSNPGLEKKQ